MRRWLRSLGLVFVASVVFFASRAAWACPACLSATDGTREAYYGTTALMMGLPFLLLGSITWWLYRAARRRDSLEAPVMPNRHTEQMCCRAGSAMRPGS